ncbi:Asg7p NDAI_0B00270 [Naumovozyma dairenensis CBS 421]|uniref:Uncharacterized protein n=1 Tax=Naumovozyma dairenensis (strain ATCC 10597 / BCRC 20456 / CBS 421 / NBRC 0211 / NRRL Y-12639) TaxID=1071378 RepID=G0W5K0_NAUDC|nr:hypothetical protein NDAI_0B00270 [Naumovozyma dairenensis CBS 421]CCD23061.1 hypothetical protein NDAI_0B00270 [Naumovozyma dairenensis CBS 421]
MSSSATLTPETSSINISDYSQDDFVHHTNNNNSKVRYLIASFDEEKIEYKCECKSCIESRKYSRLLIRSFWIGIVIPFIWIISLGVSLYLQYWLNHEVHHDNLSEEEFPTVFENERYSKRSQLKLSKNTVREMTDLKAEEKSRTNNFDISIGNNKVENNNNNNNDDDEYKKMKYEYLKKVVEGIVDDHDILRQSYRTWNLRTIGAILVYVIVIVIVVVLCIHHSSNEMKFKRQFIKDIINYC